MKVGKAIMKRSEFEKLVLEALEDLPAKFKHKIENVEIVIEEWPNQETFADMPENRQSILLGLYQGIPFPRRGVLSYANVLPDKITLYQKPLESLCRNEKELQTKVREVLVHEIGHYFGLTEEELKS